MTLHQKITSARHQMGLTQEEVAGMANVTVRTIQRIESGESVPRKFTLKLIAAALNIPFEELNTVEPATEPVQPAIATTSPATDDQFDFLRLLCLSCFSYLLIPYIHFLIPAYLLKKRNETDNKVVRFARKVIQQQVVWVILTTLVFLTALGYNFFQAAYLNKQYPVNYILLFFIMYLVNAFVISINYFKINRVLTAQ